MTWLGWLVSAVEVVCALGLAHLILASFTRTPRWASRRPRAADGAGDDFVQVGTWLLPEAYGAVYDHFTQTRMETRPGQCIALFARKPDLVGTPYEYRATDPGGSR